MRLRVAALTLAGAVAAVAAAGAALRAPEQTPRTAAAEVAALPAPVQLAVPARTSARRRAPVVATVPTRTPEGTRNIVAVLGHAQDRAGRPWVRVRLAVLPNGTTGWMPRGALGGYGTVNTRLDINLRKLRATLLRAGRPVLRAPIGAGMAGWPTPRGRFYIRNRLTRYSSPTYGPVAFGTSARSAVATDWPAGGFVGIHGTDQAYLVPGRVSHGCIRMRNADILALARRMPIGTPVTIH
jgi:lipoprotein-anchoring transpeptidase ErfK/SrfK